MRRCFNIDYPQREETDNRGNVVRVVSLPQVKCGKVAVLSSLIVWPNGERQRTYSCDEHAAKLEKTQTDAGFPWDPRPYAPGK